jgi:uncharacterized membrane protein
MVAIVAAPFIHVPAIYSAASLVCHQLPERSFHAAAGPFAVCARCLGLYAGAFAGLWFAEYHSHRFRGRGAVTPAEARALVGISAVPTGATLIAEWLLGLPVGNVSRFVAALPVGGAAAFAVTSAMTAERRSMG